MQTKVCKTCGIEKPISEFHKGKEGAMGVIAHCRECKNWNHMSPQGKEEEATKWRLLAMGFKKCGCCGKILPVSSFPINKNRPLGLKAYCYDCQREKALKRSRREDVIKKQKEYMTTEGYFKRLHERYRKKMDTQPDFKTATYLRNQLYNGITGYGSVRKEDFITMIGLTPKELNKYLETLFEKGMTWENHNRHGWHTDHIIPMSAFRMDDYNEQRASCYYVNLRPMWGRPNIQKGAKYNPEDFDAYMKWFIKNVINK